MKSTPDTPKIGNGHVQLIRLDESQGVKGLRATGAVSFSRSQMDNLQEAHLMDQHVPHWSFYQLNVARFLLWLSMFPLSR